MRMGVMCSEALVPVMIRAAVHSTLQPDQNSVVVLVRWQKMMPRSST